MDYILGIDIGTSGCKCALLDSGGKPCKSIGREYHATMYTDGTVEQDPNDWYQAVMGCLNDLASKETVDLKKIVAVSVTGQMQGITLLDKAGEPVRKSILWNDIRCEKETDALNTKYRTLFEKKISFAATPAISVSKIQWLKKYEPDNWKKTAKFTLASSFISYKLTGNITTDENNITLTGLNDVPNNSWSYEIIDLCGVERSKVPELTGCFDVVGYVTQKAARETGLMEGIPVVAGGGDAGAESYSIAIAGKSQLKIRLGSAADLNMVVHVDKVRHMEIWPGIRDVMRDYILIGRYTKACASSIKWMRDVYYSELPSEGATYNIMDNEAAATPLGSEGILYHPYLSGENAPYFNTALRAKFNGINIGHRRGHFMRAAYEGVSFSIKDVIQSNNEFQNAKEYVFVGGGTKSKLWISILSDILGKGGIIPEYCDASYGAALMAGHGVGLWDGLTVATKNLENSARVRFDQQNYEKYQAIFEKYMELAGK
jgi:xylulokinase